MFKGTYRHRIDPKGRLGVPAAFRRQMREEASTALVVTGLDQCLAAYPPSEWARLETQLRALPAFSKPAKALVRLLASRAADCVLDSQGRILIPAGLRKAAELGGEVVIVGVLSRFEIWSPSTWDAFVRESERILEDAALDFQWPPPERSSSAPPPAVRPQAKPRR